MDEPRAETHAEKIRRELEEILRRVDGLPITDSRPVEEVLPYDENGLPE